MLSLSSVGAGYGRLEVLRDISFQLPQGRVIGLLGANGAGKTTLLGTIMGLVPLREGRIDFLGESIGNKAPHEVVRRGITLVPQSRELFAQMTVRENLSIAGLTAATRAETAARLEEQLLTFPRLRERLEQRVHTMSGGEQQMVAIARALMLRPKVLMLDEPTAGLAPLVINDLARAIRKLNEGGQTILLVEQNLGLILAVTERVHVLRNGRNVFGGETHELKRDKEVLKMYLE
ncbi:MAG TPA: ABC transporter ATP-binding protein [Burkholderiaceae bacterium]|nr:ABC transporter ATP-binding protein [Burkholderiaceae bacterium]